MKKITLILLFTIPLLALKCNKDPEPPIEPIDQLPPATQTGENTFGCLVDGEVWLPEKTSLFGPIIQVDFFDTNQIGIQTGKEREFLSLYFQIHSLDNIQLLDTFFIGYFDNDVYPNCVFDSNTQFKSILLLDKFDTTNRIISGTFEGELIERDTSCSNKIIHITDGRFDLRY